MYIGWDNREYEDPEMDAMREDARQTSQGASEWTGEEIQSHDKWLSGQAQGKIATFYEVYNLAWPGGGTLVQEFSYRVDGDTGQVLPGQMWNEEAHAALQALVDYRGPEALKPGRGNELSEASEEESRLHHTLALALLSPERRKEYYQDQEQVARIDQALALVREAHQPVSFDPVFTCGGVVELDNGTALVEVSDAGPNWTYRFTQYVLAMTPAISIVEAYTPFGEHSFNHHFHTGPIYEPDESGMYDNFPATLARLWSGLDWLSV